MISPCNFATTGEGVFAGKYAANQYDIS